MSQDVFTTIDPTISGDTLATTLDAFKNALMSGLSGTSRPSELQAGGGWIDTTNNPTSWTYKVYTGSTDVSIFTLNLTSGLASVALAVDSFLVKKVSADTVGAILELIKNRIASSGQVLSGDVVGEIRMVGRTNTSTNPVVGKIIWTATDDQTSSAYGGTLSFYSTPDATATLTEHMRLINGTFETVVPHKINSQILVGQNVATSATIAQLSAAKILVEMTGATATAIQGINSAHDSKVITVHNRSSANVTLKHQNASAAAADRLKLPNSADYIIVPDGSATLYYCTTDTFWKLLSSSETSATGTIDTYYGASQTWTAPSTTTQVKIRAYRLQNGAITERSGFLDTFGNAYAWGANASGQLGDASIIPKSSPVAVLGAAVPFVRAYGQTGAGNSCFAIGNNGSAYAWGVNTNGQLGDASAIAKSSPVAVAGGFKFNSLIPRDASVLGQTTNNALYAWGVNTNGQLGVGDVTARSSPVAVLRSLKFTRVEFLSGAATNAAVGALDNTGAAYCWGINTQGNLGVGDVVPRSSPVAVLGGLTFVDIQGGAASSRYFFIALTSAGAAYGWGANTSSTLGLGDQTPRSSPVAVLGGLAFKRLFINPKSETSFAMTSAGAVYAWGDNTGGVIGDGTIVNKSSPVAVLGGLTFVKLSPYKSSVIGLTSDGTAYAWGLNANGQLGVGDVTARSSPVAVLGGLKFADVVWADGPADTYAAYGITPDGQMYAWGLNSNGTLGVGDVTPRSSPVAVLGIFAADMRETATGIDLPVTGGSSYTVGIGAGNSSFGSTPIGRDIYKVEIEYFQ